MAANDLSDLPELSTFSPGIPLVYTDPEQFNEDLGVSEDVACSRPVDVLRWQLLQCVAASAYELPLPPGWSEHTDQNGCVFFASTFRAEASWSHPLQEAFKETICFAKGLIDTGLTVDDAASSIKTHLGIAQQRAVTRLQAWSGPYRDEDTGDEFFHNMVSGESDWQNPIELLQYELYARYMLLVVFMEELNATKEEPSGSVSPFSDITLTPKGGQRGRSPRKSIVGQRKVSPIRRKRMSQNGKADDLTPLSSPHSSYTLGTAEWPANCNLQRIASTFSRDSVSTVVSALSAAVQPHAAELAGCLAISGPRHQSKGPPPLKRPPPLARQRTGNQGVAPPKSPAPRRRMKMDIQTLEPVTREGSPERERLELSIRELSPPESPCKTVGSATWPLAEEGGIDNAAASQPADQASQPTTDGLQAPPLEPPAPKIEKPPDPPHDPPPPANVAVPEPNRETPVEKQAAADSPGSGATMTRPSSKGGFGPIQRRLCRSDGAGSGSSSVVCTVS